MAGEDNGYARSTPGRMQSHQMRRGGNPYAPYQPQTFAPQQIPEQTGLLGAAPPAPTQTLNQGGWAPATQNKADEFGTIQQVPMEMNTIGAVARNDPSMLLGWQGNPWIQSGSGTDTTEIQNPEFTKYLQDQGYQVGQKNLDQYTTQYGMFDRSGQYTGQGWRQNQDPAGDLRGLAMVAAAPIAGYYAAGGSGAAAAGEAAPSALGYGTGYVMPATATPAVAGAAGGAGGGLTYGQYARLGSAAANSGGAQQETYTGSNQPGLFGYGGGNTSMLDSRQAAMDQYSGAQPAGGK
jgi:hypothetical protein